MAVVAADAAAAAADAAAGADDLGASDHWGTAWGATGSWTDRSWQWGPSGVQTGPASAAEAEAATAAVAAVASVVAAAAAAAAVAAVAAASVAVACDVGGRDVDYGEASDEASGEVAGQAAWVAGVEGVPAAWAPEAVAWAPEAVALAPEAYTSDQVWQRGTLVCTPCGGRTAEASGEGNSAWAFEDTPASLVSCGPNEEAEAALAAAEA